MTVQDLEQSDHLPDRDRWAGADSGGGHLPDQDQDDAEVENRWALLLADTSISASVLMFLAGVGPLIAARARPGRPATISQAEVEVHCGLDRDTVFQPGGCADQAVLLDLVDFDRGAARGVVAKEQGGYVGEAGEWTLGTGHFPATVTKSRSSPSASWVSDIPEHLSVCGRELSGQQAAAWQHAMDPVNDIWAALGRYRWHWWRYFSLVGPVDHLAKAGDLKRLLGVSPRAATRMLDAARPTLADRRTGGSTLLRGSHLADTDAAWLSSGFSRANKRAAKAAKEQKEYLRRHGGPGDGFTTYGVVEGLLSQVPQWLTWAEQVPGVCPEGLDLLRSLEGDMCAVAAFCGHPDDASGADAVQPGATSTAKQPCLTCVGGAVSMRCFH